MKTERKSALIAGISLIIMAVAAAFAFGFVHSSLVIPGDSEATFINLTASKSLFLLEIIGWIIILICDVAVSLALYYFFKNDNRKLSFSTAFIRLVYSAILGVAIFYLIQVFNLLGGNTDLSGTAMSNIDSFKTAWSFGLIIFGVHLFLLGILAVKSSFIHRIWGILLIFAGISYSLIHVSNFLFPDFESQIKMVETALSAPMAIAEIGFAIWLIVRGGKPRTVFQTS